MKLLIARLPVRDNIQRQIRILRQNALLVKGPNDPMFAAVPTLLIKTRPPEQFLRCDTGPGMFLNFTDNEHWSKWTFLLHVGDDRILALASDEQIAILQNTDNFWLMELSKFSQRFFISYKSSMLLIETTRFQWSMPCYVRRAKTRINVWSTRYSSSIQAGLHARSCLISNKSFLCFLMFFFKDVIDQVSFLSMSEHQSEVTGNWRSM